MRTTKQISEKLDTVQKEIERISVIVSENTSKLKEPYQYKNGNIHPEWKYEDALVSYVAQKSILRWILNMN